jgi:hypothetical protein
MLNFWLIQAFYCLSGIGFFIQDMMYDKVPMGDAMVRAFIWPYAQWGRISTFFTETLMGSITGLF